MGKYRPKKNKQVMKFARIYEFARIESKGLFEAFYAITKKGKVYENIEPRPPILITGYAHRVWTRSDKKANWVENNAEFICSLDQRILKRHVVK